MEVGKPLNCQVSVNHHIELTEEEKAQARQEEMCIRDSAIIWYSHALLLPSAGALTISPSIRWLEVVETSCETR